MTIPIGFEFTNNQKKKKNPTFPFVTTVPMINLVSKAPKL